MIPDSHGPAYRLLAILAVFILCLWWGTVLVALASKKLSKPQYHTHDYQNQSWNTESATVGGFASNQQHSATNDNDIGLKEYVAGTLSLLSFIISYFALRASSRNADATKQAVETARRSAERQLRAYVSAEVKDVIEFNATTPAIFVFECINYGHTPAKDVEFRAIIDIAPNAAHDLPSLDKIPWNPGIMNLFPNANGRIPCNCGRIFANQEIEWIRAGTHFIFIGLEIQYWDFVVDAGRRTRNYFRVGGSPLALRILTSKGESIEVGNLPQSALVPQFSVIPRLSLIT